jgi:hypothetical protein
MRLPSGAHAPDHDSDYGRRLREGVGGTVAKTWIRHFPAMTMAADAGGRPGLSG